MLLVLERERLRSVIVENMLYVYKQKERQIRTKINSIIKFFQEIGVEAVKTKSNALKTIDM